MQNEQTGESTRLPISQWVLPIGQTAAPDFRGLEHLEPRLLLSADLPGNDLIEPVSASAWEAVASMVGNEVVYQEQTQYDNFFNPNVIVFDFPIESDASNGVIDITALSDLDSPGENVAYDIEGVVSGVLFDGEDDGVRPFTATINLADVDLAAIAADGNLHIEFTPLPGVDDFGSVSEYVTVGLTYETAPTTIALSPEVPQLPGTYRGSVAGQIDAPGDTDAYQLNLEAGQTLRIEGIPDIGLSLTIQVLDASDNVIYSGSSPAAGDPILSQAFTIPADGTYTIVVSSDGATGLYALNVFVNEAIEEESIGGADNNSLANAQSMDGQFRDIGAGIQQAVVHGSASVYVAAGNPAIASEVTESFEAGALPTGWTTNIPTGGRIQFTGTYGASDGSYAMLMDNLTTGYKLKEAIWTVDLTADRPTTLSFDYAEWGDATHSLPTSFTGSYNGDGVSISANGTTWYTVLNAWNTSSGVWYNASIDLRAAAATAGISLGPDFQIKFQQYDYSSLNSDGRGFDNIVLSTSGDVSIPSAQPDFYKVTLDADEFVSIARAQTTAGSLGFKLYDPAGNLVTPAAITSSSGLALLSDFKASTAGEYVIEVTSGGADYHLIVTRDGTLDSDSNVLINDAQRMDRTGVVTGAFDPLLLPSYYAIPVRAGDVLTFQTATPDDGVSGLNTLDPQLVLLDPSQNVVASDDNGATDGRNALLVHTATLDGTYNIRIQSSTGTGNYTLQASGYTGTSTDVFDVLTTSIADGSVRNTAPTSIDLGMSGTTLLESLDLTDLTLNGIQATTAARVGTTDTLRFGLNIAALVQGVNTISLPAGAIRNLQGDLNEPFSIQFTYDSVPPTIIESSILEGDILPAGVPTFTIRFSEPVDASLLSSGWFVQILSWSTETAIDYDELTNELTVSYESLDEGAYQFRVDDYFSGYYLRDLLGNTLDGETNAVTTVPSGNGSPGGDFIVNFLVEDGTSQPLTLATTPIMSAASFAYNGTFTNTPDFQGDEERYTLDLEAGDTFSINLGDNLPSIFESEVELWDPSGTMIATSAGGHPALSEVPITQTGTYTLLIRATVLTIPGSFSNTANVRINAVDEAEEVGGPTNDDLASAQDIGPAMFSLGNGIEQAVILGHQDGMPAVISESFESGSLGSGWSTYTSNTSYDRIQVTTAAGAADGSYALVMDTTSSSAPLVLHEAIWTLDLSYLSDITLEFAQAEWSDETHALPTSFTGHYSGDGVSFSNDGATWYTLLSSPDSTSGTWVNYSYDLSAQAAAVGITPGANFKIKFQQYDDDPRSSDGRGYDNIRISGTPIDPEPVDLYKLTLAGGEELSLAFQGTASPAAMELLNAAGERITYSSASWQDATGLISGFVAPAAGDYYIRINAVAGDYTLIATTNGGYRPEPVSASIVLSIGPSGSVVGSINQHASDVDVYSFYATAGDNLTLWTATPSFGPFGPTNDLDTYLTLEGPDGLLKAEGGTGGDGLNAQLNFTVVDSGLYTVRVSSEGVALPGSILPTRGYTLHVTGNTDAGQPLQVIQSSLTNGQKLTAMPTALTLSFSQMLRLDTIDTGDLTVNGLAATAVTIVDADTLTFTLPDGLTDGTLDFAMAAGSILGLSGQALDAYAIQVGVDTIAPHVVSTSIQNGDSLEPGDVLLTIVFNEELDASVLSSTDVYISSPDYSGYPDTFGYDPATSTLTLGFSADTEGAYNVRLTSSSAGFRDLFGNLLDGEDPGGTFPPNVSGDGVPGGNFTLNFEVDRVTPVDIREPGRMAPLGTLAAVSTGNVGYINGLDDTDTFRAFMQTGQVITAVLTPISIGNAPYELTGPEGTIVAASAGDVIQMTYVHNGAAGPIDLTVGKGYSKYDLMVYYNTLAENALPTVALPDDPAYDLSGAWVNVDPGKVDVLTVMGVGQPARSITLSNIYAPGSDTFNFTDMTTPTGDGTLTITALADLGEANEYLTINGENQFDAVVFELDGGENTLVTTTLTIPQAALEAMAANGTITFTITPSEAVGNYGGSYVALDLAYPGMPEPAFDAYAIEFEAGQTLSAVVDGDVDGFTIQLIDATTGLPVAAGIEGTGYDSALLDFVAPSAGRYDLRVISPGADDYQLTVQRGAVFDLEPNDASTDTLASLDASGSALGLLQTPGPGRLFAVEYPGIASYGYEVYELDPDTLQVVDTFVADVPLYISSMAYDGVYLYASYVESTGIWVIDPNSGNLIRTIDPPGSYSGYALATYNNQVVVKQPDQLTFLSPDSGRVTRQLPTSFYMGSDTSMAGAESRGTIFIATQTAPGDNSKVIHEVDAQTGQIVNSISQLSSLIRGMAYQDGKIYAFNNYQTSSTIEVYDADSGQWLGSYFAGSPKGSRYIYRTIGGDDVAPVAPIDRYTVTLAAGEQVTVTTATPFDHPDGMPMNSLDPLLRLYDSNGVEVAMDDNSAADGKNASLVFTATEAGVYTVEVTAVSGSGEYLLNVQRPAEPIAGDLDGDGYVGLADLDILLNHWNQTVPIGELAQGDASGDGFVGLADLDILLGNWNAGVAPLVTAVATSASSSVETVNAAAVTETYHVQTNQPVSRAQKRNKTPNTNQPQARHRATLAAWGYQEYLVGQTTRSGDGPWMTRKQDDSPALGLWEDDLG